MNFKIYVIVICVVYNTKIENIRDWYHSVLLNVTTLLVIWLLLLLIVTVGSVRLSFPRGLVPVDNLFVVLVWFCSVLLQRARKKILEHGQHIVKSWTSLTRAYLPNQCNVFRSPTKSDSCI